MIKEVYTVLELNDTVKELIHGAFPNYVWVCGEIQDLRERAHINFNLVQKHESKDQIAAQVKAIIFANAKPLIIRRIKQADSEFQLNNDIEVKLLCKVDLYSKTGQFSLTVFDIDPVYTLGKIAQNRIKIIEELRKRGLFDKNKETDMSLLPLKVGVITSFESAAYHDFINELKISGYGFKVMVIDSYMQGANVESNVVGALKRFNQYDRQDLDVVVITRGGGSTADLSFFDNKKIAETIADMRFPVIAALGHQINVTVTDMVTHTSVKTPTAAAKFLVDRIGEFESGLKYLEEKIVKGARQLVVDNKRTLETLAVKFGTSITRYFRQHKEDLLNNKHHIRRIIEVLLSQKKSEVKGYLVSLRNQSQTVLKNSKDNLNHIEEKINLLNPKNVLRRGYSITLKKGKVLKRIGDIDVKEDIETVLYDGRLISQVKETINNE